jgi:isopenicillin-N N-acyltransferase-like protein
LVLLTYAGVGRRYRRPYNAPVTRPRKALLALAGAVAALAVCHAILPSATRIEAPAVAVPAEAGARGWTGVRGGLRVVLLEGGPEALGAENARLQRAAMISEENLLWADFERFVPWRPARWLIEDYSRLHYRHLASGVPDARRRELAAQALAFEPDPMAGRMPTYQRMLFMHALYDIALPFEHSPLLGSRDTAPLSTRMGCTSFAFPSSQGHTLFARAFDFEADEVFDREKVVYLVREDGAVPFASVAWPGFVGVVTGMNAEGVALVAHGGRAGEPRAEGMPAAFSLREALSRAHSTDEAAAILAAQPVMVSHIVFVADGAGHLARVERAPGRAAYVRRDEGAAWVTNDFVGPLASDPANARVRATTTTVDRGDRIAALLEDVMRGPAEGRTPERALAMLRDHECEHARGCPPGDRRSIDARIATHGVVADTTSKTLWVSAGPHLAGPFVRFDLATMLAPGFDPAALEPAESLPPEAGE